MFDGLGKDVFVCGTARLVGLESCSGVSGLGGLSFYVVVEGPRESSLGCFWQWVVMAERRSVGVGMGMVDVF